MNVTAQVGDTLFQASGATPLALPAAKAALRADLRRRRKAIPPVMRARAAIAVARLSQRCSQLRLAKRVAVYLSIGSELPTGPLIAALQARGCAVFAPALRHHRMGFRALRNTPVRRHDLGMPQPCSGTIWRASSMDVVIMPLLGFDVQGTRLGQGGGYYDRALSMNRFRPYRLGLAYRCQQLDFVPREPWDQSLNAVLTERGLHRFTRKLTG